MRECPRPWEKPQNVRKFSIKVSNTIGAEFRGVIRNRFNAERRLSIFK